MKQTSENFVKDIRNHMRDGKGEVTISHMFKGNLPGKCRLFAQVTLEPDCSIGYHVHKDETEFYYIQKGNATVDDDGEARQVKQGDVIMTKNGHGHSIENTGDTTMEMIAVIILD